MQLSTGGFGHDIKTRTLMAIVADVIVSQSDGHGEYVLYGVGDGTFADAYKFNQAHRRYGGLHLNGDGYPDVITETITLVGASSCT